LKRIELRGKYGTGKFALVDDQDFECLSEFKGWVSDKGYVVSSIAGYMHRMVVKPPPGLVTDHKNHDKLDNRRENLRIATYTQNAANGPKSKALSGYRGVTPYRYYSTNNRWKATIMNRNLGLFESPEKAAVAYNTAAVAMWGEFASLNSIPEQTHLTPQGQMLTGNLDVVAKQGNMQNPHIMSS
jgi:hypothetical protein